MITFGSVNEWGIHDRRMRKLARRCKYAARARSVSRLRAFAQETHLGVHLSVLTNQHFPPEDAVLLMRREAWPRRLPVWAVFVTIPHCPADVLQLIASFRSVETDEKKRRDEDDAYKPVVVAAAKELHRRASDAAYLPLAAE